LHNGNIHFSKTEHFSVKFISNTSTEMVLRCIFAVNPFCEEIWNICCRTLCVSFENVKHSLIDIELPVMVRI